MAAKDKCIICGKPATGRFCYDHLGELLDQSRELYNHNLLLWRQQIDLANKPKQPKITAEL